MKKPSKLQILILLGIAVAATVILAAGLSNLKLLPGQPFSFPFFGERAPVEPGQYGTLPGGELLLSLVRGLLILLALLVPVIVILAIVYPEFRKRMLRRLLSITLLLVCLYALMRLRPDIFGITEEIQIPDQAAPSEQASPLPVTEMITEPPYGSRQWPAYASPYPSPRCSPASQSGFSRTAPGARQALWNNWPRRLKRRSSNCALGVI